MQFLYLLRYYIHPFFLLNCSLCGWRSHCLCIWRVCAVLFLHRWSISECVRDKNLHIMWKRNNWAAVSFGERMNRERLLTSLIFFSYIYFICCPHIYQRVSHLDTMQSTWKNSLCKCTSLLLYIYAHSNAWVLFGIFSKKQLYESNCS